MQASGATPPRRALVGGPGADLRAVRAYLVGVADSAPLPLIEIGWLVAGELEAIELPVVDAARERLLAYLRRVLPEFVWRMPVLQRRRLVESTQVEPVTLLEAAATEREAHRWDFVIVVTDAELHSRYTAFALGMPSRALSAAVLSTAHLEPAAFAERSSDALAEMLTERIEHLALHLLGHLNGLQHCDDRTSAMWQVRTAQDLDRIEGYNEPELAHLRRELCDVADVRLEEEPGPRLGPLLFHLTVAWRNRDDILAAVRQIAPWTFPLRFSRLTIAAVSTLLVLVITAESWDLGMSQDTRAVTVFACLSVLGSTVFVLQRHRLLVRRTSRLTEQTVITRLSMALAVLVGMAGTWLLLFAIVFGASQVLFGEDLVRGWAASLDGPPQLEHYLVFSGFVATFGILIGALGASFEPGGYFRHVAYIDEET